MLVGTSAKHQLLVVEDDLDIRIHLREALEMEEYDVHTAENGKKALDMAMPVMGGREFMNCVARDAELAKIPVVVVSATSTPAEEVGAQAVVPKPIDLEHLLRTVARLVR